MTDELKKLNIIIQRENDTPLTLAEFETLENIYSNLPEMQAAIRELRGAVKTMQWTYPYSPPCHNWQPQVDAHKAAKVVLENTKKWSE